MQAIHLKDLYNLHINDKIVVFDWNSSMYNIMDLSLGLVKYCTSIDLNVCFQLTKL